MQKFSGEIIDSHVHPFIDKDEDISPFGGVKSPEDFVLMMKESGISRCCGSIIRRLEKPEWADLESLNRKALALRDRFPDFYIPGIHIHPAFPAESCSELFKMHKEGVRWVGELVPYHMSYNDCTVSAMYEIFSAMTDLKLPLNLHICTLEQTEKIAKDFPAMNIVIAHPTFEVQERLSLVKSCPNLYLDLSGCAVGRFRLTRTAIDTVGKDKLLFGTDFPICHPAASLAAVLSDINSQEEFDALMSMNFKRLTAL